jgi:putative transposase
MRRWRISWKRGRLHVTSPDPQYLEKLAAIDQALAQARLYPDEVRLLYSDEVTCYRKPFVGSCWAEQGRGGQHQQKGWLGHGANTIRRIVGTLDAVTGRVLYRSNSRIGVSQLVAFLKQIRRAYGSHVRLILAWDNWPMHSYDNVLAEAKAQNIELLYLPTYAPWTNPIEKLWRKLKQEVLCMHDLADYWKELKQRVHDFLAAYDRDAPDLLKYVGLVCSFAH